MATRNPLVVGADGLPQALQPGDTLGGALDGNVTAATVGYRCWTYDPVLSATTRTLASNNIYAALTAPGVAIANATVLNVECNVVTAGVTFTYARVGVYKYDASTGTSTQIGLSADLSAVFNSTGAKVVPITLSAAVAATDLLYVAVLSNATTSVTLSSVASNMTAGRGTPFRSGAYIGPTTLPTTFTQANLASSANLPFFAF